MGSIGRRVGNNELPLGSVSESSLGTMSREPVLPIDLPDDPKTRKTGTTRFGVFVLEVLWICGLAVVAYFLKYTDEVPTVYRSFRCYDQTISYPLEPAFGRNNSLPLRSFSEGSFYGITVAIPLIVIVCVELILAAFRDQTKRKSLYLAIRRLLRFIGGFLCGLLVTSIATDALKSASGQFRPYFLSVCPLQCLGQAAGFSPDPPEPEDEFIFCGISENNTEIFKDTLRDGRRSFPSADVALATYSGIFIIIYLNLIANNHWTRVLRTTVCGAISVGILLLSNAKLASNRNHAVDVYFSLGLGAAVSLFMAFVHLERFEEPVKSKEEDDREDKHDDNYFLRYFQIPRVIYRGSRRMKSHPQPQEIRVSSTGIINPAFRHESEDRAVVRPQMDSRLYN